MASFRTPLGRRRKNDGNGSVQQCGDHCECCEIRTTEERYTVSVKNCNPGSKVNIGDSVKVYRVDNLNLSSNERTVVLLDKVTTCSRVRVLVAVTFLQLSANPMKHLRVNLRLFIRVNKKDVL